MEVKELYKVEEVNELLQDGNWKLLEFVTEKVVRTTIEESEGCVILGGLIYASAKGTPVVNEELKTKYILGRYEE